MKLKDLKVGDVVYIREDVNKLEKWANKYDEPRLTGVQQIFKVDYDNERFKIIGELDMALIIRNSYTVEMVDWEKTRDLKINESWENIKRAISGGSTFKEISQSGESGNETTKAIGYDLREITVKNNGEENDIEKAVMLLMLKSLGVTYSDVKREVEKVKWEPIAGEQFYYISTTPALKVRAVTYFTDSALKDMTDVGNCFRTREEAEEKLEKVKEILKGEE